MITEQQIEDRDRLEFEARKLLAWTHHAIWAAFALVVAVAYAGENPNSDLAPLLGIGGMLGLGYALYERKELRRLRAQIEGIHESWEAAGYQLKAAYGKPGLQPVRQSSDRST